MQSNSLDIRSETNKISMIFSKNILCVSYIPKLDGFKKMIKLLLSYCDLSHLVLFTLTVNWNIRLRSHPIFKHNSMYDVNKI